jgi:multisubunit Na+/H+ antiporter MnhB subunit
MIGHSPILHVVCQYSVPLTVLVALRVFWQGHDLPGGGFIAGVLLAAAGAMGLLAYGTAWAESRPWWKLSIVGLSISIANGIVPFLAGKAFMDNTFFDVGPLHLPTAVFFDFGVMLIVTGTLMTIFVELAQEHR